jgi:hypothetical protein
VRTSESHRQQLDRVLGIRRIKIQLCHWHETHREVEGARLSVFRPRVGSVGEGFHQHESISVGSELVAQRHDDRITGGAVARVEWSDHGWTIPLGISEPFRGDPGPA